MCKLYTLLLLLIISTGCALGPDFESPAQNSAQKVKFRVPPDHSEATEKPGLASHEWQKIYHEPELQKLIEEGLKNNLDLKTARLRLAQSQAARVIAKAPLLPVADLFASGEREQKSKLSNPNNGISEEFEIGATVKWEVDLWGVNRRSLEVAEAEVKAASYGIYAQQISIIAAIANTYFDLQNAINREEITESTIKTREKVLKLLILRKEGGIISGLDVRQAEVALAQAQASLPGIVIERVQLENALSILLGEEPRAIEINNPLSIATLPTEIPVGLPSNLLQRRPDIQVAEAKLHAATASIGIAKGALFPSFNLTAGFGRLSPTFSDLTSGQGKTWDIGAGLLQPLFNAGANLANLERARLEHEEALLSYEKSLLTALSEVSNSLQVYYSADNVLRASEQLLISSRGYLRLAHLQYRNGVIGFLDVLDAQRQLFDAELSLSNAQTKKLNALVQLYKALGGGWQAQDATVPDA